VNAFFVRTDLANDRVPHSSVEDGFVRGQFREARDASGRLAWLGPDEEDRILAAMPLVTVGDDGLPQETST
jgi:hypothetical protein